MIAFLVVILSILVLFVSYRIVASVEREKNREGKSIGELLGKRANKERVYLCLAFVIPPVNGILIFWLGPLISKISRSPFEFEGVRAWLGVGIVAFLFIYFTGVYYLGRKLLALEFPSSQGRLFLISTLFVSFCLWPLVISIVMAS